MARLTQIDPATATGRTKELLDAVNHKLGFIPNMTRAMASAPAALDAYLQLSGALGKSRLPVRAREQIALAIAEANDCDYCLAAHSAVARMVGLTADQIRDARLGTAVDPKADALIHFARRVLETRGQVDDRDLQNFRDAGYDDGAAAEVVATVTLDIFTNYFNRLADTDVDFPKAAPLDPTLVANSR